jgi:hypothetical protein
LPLLTLADKVIPAVLLGYLSLIAIFAKTAAIFEGSAVFEDSGAFSKETAVVSY